MTAKAAGSDPGPSSREWIGVVRHYLPSVVIFFVALLLWELLVRAANLQRFVLPRPTAIGAAFAERSDTLIPSARETLFEAIGGLAIGTSAGLAVAFLAARFTTMRDALLPWGVAASAVPIIAFAPIMNNWFGVISPLSKMMIVAVLVFFPVMINVTRGLSLVDPGALELMRSYAAGETTVLRQVRIPNALPYFFTAMKIATTLSLIGAIVGEYFGGADLVLGRQIVQSASALRFDVTWAAIALGAVTGVVFYLIVAGVERLVIPWHSSHRQAG